MNPDRVHLRWCGCSGHCSAANRSVPHPSRANMNTATARGQWWLLYRDACYTNSRLAHVFSLRSVLALPFYEPPVDALQILSPHLLFCLLRPPWLPHFHHANRQVTTQPLFGGVDPQNLVHHVHRHDATARGRQNAERRAPLIPRLGRPVQSAIGLDTPRTRHLQAMQLHFTSRRGACFYVLSSMLLVVHTK